MERTMEERRIHRAWDIVEWDPGVSPIHSVRYSSSPTENSQLLIVHAREESKGTLDEFVRHRVGVSQIHRRSLDFKGSQESPGEREGHSLARRAASGLQPTKVW